MPLAGFEPATQATKQPQTYALDRAVTEVGVWILSIGIHCTLFETKEHKHGDSATTYF
jgi:hypothetical protein